MTPGAQHSDVPSAQPLRSDAERNRERIIAAARTVFARDGLNASMASVAREAGVGIATMFRRFPTKEELVDAVFSDRMRAYADAVTAALDDPDPWKGFVGYIESACAMQAADNGFADVLTMTFPTAKALERLRNEAYEGMLGLIDRAKATGRLREDFDSSDLVLIHMANAGCRQCHRRRRPGRLATRRRPAHPVPRDPGTRRSARLTRARTPLRGHAPGLPGHLHTGTRQGQLTLGARPPPGRSHL